MLQSAGRQARWSRGLAAACAILLLGPAGGLAQSDQSLVGTYDTAVWETVLARFDDVRLEDT